MAHRIGCIRTLALCALVLLSACASRGTIQMAPAGEVVGSPVEVFVASSRQPDPEGPGFLLSPGPGLSFAADTVLVPPDRAPGTVRFAAPGRVDPRSDFLIADSARIADRRAFIREIDAVLRPMPVDEREIFVFVHGFNTNFAEGLYRHAQMRHDFGSPGVAVHYSWPSAASVTAYATDRERVLQARDDLEQLIDILTRTSAKRIVMAGHSMGAFLVMEAMRQKAIRDAPGAFRKLDAVVLIAPDIDIGVFRRQARDLAAQDVSIYVVSSSRDRALRFSAALRGTSARLGSVPDVSGLSDLPVTVIDLSDVETENDALGHFKVATSPVMISLLGGLDTFGPAILRDTARQPGLLDAGVTVLQDVSMGALQPIADR